MKQHTRMNESVIETKTPSTIYTGQNSKAIYRHLNGGVGFCGFTPEFFLQRIMRK